MIVEGILKKSKLGTQVATKGLVFGDEYLLENTRQQPKVLDDDIILENDGVVAEIPFEQFVDLIGGKLEEVIKRNEEKYPNIIKAHITELTKSREELRDSRLEQFIFLHKLPRNGQFGPLFLARLTNNSEPFVIKCIQKSLVSDLNVDKFFINCKKAQEQVFHPLVVKYLRTFKDNHYIYFMYEYVRGMELYDVIREMGLLNTYEAQFYVASMILVLENLHHAQIIHRDIKPENIMVDADGYLKLTDLSTAKQMKGKAAKAFTIIGTPHYMAPEILTGKGYSFSVDLWSLGVCLYEFMCGLVPFGEEAEDPYDIYEEIVRKDIKFPSYLKDRKAKKLIDQLLNRTPEQRVPPLDQRDQRPTTIYLGLKCHSWFDNFDWVLIYQLS
jgi:cGMP-dependent protein kinase